MRGDASFLPVWYHWNKNSSKASPAAQACSHKWVGSQLYIHFHAPTCTELLCKFPGEVEGNSSEVGVPQQIVQIVAQQLKHQTEMVPKHKVTLQVDWTD